MTPKKGVRLSENEVSEAVRRSGFSIAKFVAPKGESGERGSVLATPPDEVDKLLVTARKTFRDGNFQRAEKMAVSISNRLKLYPKNPKKKLDAKSESRDADALQFLSLVSFSQNKYEDAAEQAHLALHHSSPWNWETLSEHYKKTKVYTSQLKELENSIRKKSTAEKRFLVGYHYLMQGHKDAARKQLELAQKLQPKNEVIQSLLRQIRKGEKR